VEIYSIGFTRKTAAEFFGALRSARIQQLLDVRLNNSSQLAGFAKRNDLTFFLRELCSAGYRHEPLLAPTPDLLVGYRKKLITWSDYEERFVRLLEDRRVEDALDPEYFATRTVLLCSEPTPERCHRRLVIEYLDSKWGSVAAIHL
jgi:uncharacterized protein (DUF488 family)